MCMSLSDDGDQIICWRCGKPGHIRRMCHSQVPMQFKCKSVDEKLTLESGNDQ